MLSTEEKREYWTALGEIVTKKRAKELQVIASNIRFLEFNLVRSANDVEKQLAIQIYGSFNEECFTKYVTDKKERNKLVETLDGKINDILKETTKIIPQKNEEIEQLRAQQGYQRRDFLYTDIETKLKLYTDMYGPMSGYGTNNHEGMIDDIKSVILKRFNIFF